MTHVLLEATPGLTSWLSLAYSLCDQFHYKKKEKEKINANKTVNRREELVGWRGSFLFDVVLNIHGHEINGDVTFADPQG